LHDALPISTNELHTLDPKTGVSTGTRFELGEDGVVSPDGDSLVQVYGTAYAVWRLDGAGPVTALLSNSAAQWMNGYAPNGDLLVGHAGEAIRLVDPVSATEHGQLAGVEQIVPNPTG